MKRETLYNKSFDATFVAMIERLATIQLKMKTQPDDVIIMLFKSSSFPVNVGPARL